MRKVLKMTSDYYFYIIILVIISVSFFTFKCLIKTDNVLAKIKENKEEIINNKKVENAKNIKIDIKGKIVNPGVYSLPENSRVIDAINMAGGFSDSADTTLINLSKKLKDEMVVVIYSTDEIKAYNEGKIKTEYVYVEIDSCPDKINNACANEYKSPILEETQEETLENLNTENNSLISINSASLEQLMTLPSIGESKANSIIEYRSQNGNFKNIEEIKNVSGIGDSIFETVKEKITV